MEEDAGRNVSGDVGMLLIGSIFDLRVVTLIM